MQTTTDDIQIFELLEAAGLANFAPDAPQAFFFRHEDVVHLFLFQPIDPGKGVRLLTLDQGPGAPELEQDVLPFLLNLPERHPAECQLKTEALRITELLLLSKNYRMRFFDAH